GAWSGGVRREKELPLGGSAPASEAGGLDELVSARVEDADIDGVARTHAERRGHSVRVAIGDIDATGVLRHVKGKIEVAAAPEVVKRDPPAEADRVRRYLEAPFGCEDSTALGR